MTLVCSFSNIFDVALLSYVLGFASPLLLYLIWWYKKRKNALVKPQ